MPLHPQAKANARRVKIKPEHGHYLFPADVKEGDRCPHCQGVFNKRKAERQYMWPVPVASTTQHTHACAPTHTHTHTHAHTQNGPRARNILRSELLLKDLRFQFTRDKVKGDIDDAWDGLLYRRLMRRCGATVEEPWKAMAYKMSNDPVEMTTRQTSFTPVWATPMSQSYRVRSKPGAYQLMMLLGKRFKNLPLALERYFSLPDNHWGADDPVVLPATEHRPAMSSVQELVINAGDTRATPLANCQTQTCKCGACTHCWVRGALVEASGTRGIFYFAAYSRCSDEKREELRGEMQASFGKVHPAVRRGVRRVSVCTYVCVLIRDYDIYKVDDFISFIYILNELLGSGRRARPHICGETRRQETRRDRAHRAGS